MRIKHGQLAFFTGLGARLSSCARSVFFAAYYLVDLHLCVGLFFFSFCVPEAPADSLWRMEENLDEKIDVFSSTCTRVLYVNEAILRT